MKIGFRAKSAVLKREPQGKNGSQTNDVNFRKCDGQITSKKIVYI